MASISGDIILETEDLTKEFAGFVAVNGVNLRVERGTINATNRSGPAPRSISTRAKRVARSSSSA